MCLEPLTFLHFLADNTSIRLERPARVEKHAKVEAHCDSPLRLTFFERGGSQGFFDELSYLSLSSRPSLEYIRRVPVATCLVPTAATSTEREASCAASSACFSAISTIFQISKFL